MIITSEPPYGMSQSLRTWRQASPAEVKRSPLLGEHNEEVLRDVLGYDGDALAQVWASGAVGERPAQAAE